MSNDSEVYALVQLRNGSVWHVEFFSERPRTPGVDPEADAGNWPDEYEVYVGNIDGGDSLLIEKEDGLTALGSELARIARDVQRNIAATVAATGRAEHEACQCGTVGCSVDHDNADAACAPW